MLVAGQRGPEVDGHTGSNLPPHLTTRVGRKGVNVDVGVTAPQCGSHGRHIGPATDVGGVGGRDRPRSQGSIRRDGTTTEEGHSNGTIGAHSGTVNVRRDDILDVSDD